MKNTFDHFCKEEGITLNEWQQTAAIAFLQRVKRGNATGKTFLLKTLTDFFDIHGNDFEISGVCTCVPPKRRGYSNECEGCGQKIETDDLCECGEKRVLYEVTCKHCAK